MCARAYTAQQLPVDGIATIRLGDLLHGVEVSIVPSIGNRVYEMLVRGENILHCNFDSLSALKKDRHLNGIPFLAPWANRMPEGFHANGKKYLFDVGFDSIRLDQNGIPIHGMLTASPFWEVIDLGADSRSAHVTCRLEFWRHPDLMVNWPFAHDYEMTYRLADGVLETAVTVMNRSCDPMPVAVGFHPYFQLPGIPMEEAIAHIPVRRRVAMDDRMVATGETTPVGFTNQVSLKERSLDDGFTDLLRTPDGRSVFSVEARGKKIEVAFGPRYSVAIVYAPPGQNFICFEPMSAITNGINLAYEGKYHELQTVAPGGHWEESFWIRTSGF